MKCMTECWSKIGIAEDALQQCLKGVVHVSKNFSEKTLQLGSRCQHRCTQQWCSLWNEGDWVHSSGVPQESLEFFLFRADSNSPSEISEPPVEMSERSLVMLFCREPPAESWEMSLGMLFRLLWSFHPRWIFLAAMLRLTFSALGSRSSVGLALADCCSFAGGPAFSMDFEAPIGCSR